MHLEIKNLNRRIPKCAGACSAVAGETAMKVDHGGLLRLLSKSKPDPAYLTFTNCSWQQNSRISAHRSFADVPEKLDVPRF